MRHATTFIRKAVSAGTPWLLYFADLHPHTALFNHPRFGPGPPGPFESGNGQYGQVLREMDWAVGELLNALDELQIERDTLVIFTSDNGPYQEEGWSQSGRKGGLKGGKGQTWEGGIRVPAIVRWPGVVPAGAVSSAPVRALDIMPTVAAFAGVRLPVGLQIDGVDQSAFFQRPTDALNGWLSTRRTSFHYCGTRPIAARYLEYKIHWATQRWDPGHEATCTECCPRAGYTAGLFGSTTLCQCDGKALDERSPPLIFNIRRDPNETRPIKPGSAEHTHVVHAAELVRARVGRDACRRRARCGRDACARCPHPDSPPPPPFFLSPACALPPLAPASRRATRTCAQSKTMCRASTARCPCRSRRGRAAPARCPSVRPRGSAASQRRSVRHAPMHSSTTCGTAVADASAITAGRATAALTGRELPGRGAPGRPAGSEPHLWPCAVRRGVATPRKTLAVRAPLPDKISARASAPLSAGPRAARAQRQAVCRPARCWPCPLDAPPRAASCRKMTCCCL